MPARHLFTKSIRLPPQNRNPGMPARRGASISLFLVPDQKASLSINGNIGQGAKNHSRTRLSVSVHGPKTFNKPLWMVGVMVERVNECTVWGQAVLQAHGQCMHLLL